MKEEEEGEIGLGRWREREVREEGRDEKKEDEDKIKRCAKNDMCMRSVYLE